MTGAVSMWTDGACSGNPGPSGSGAILSFGGHEKKLFGGEASTTNNRMELTAAIEALEPLKKPCIVHLHTDSNYLKTGITAWIVAWKRNGWRTAGKKPVKNAKLWHRLDLGAARHEIDWRWVINKGHNDDVMNMRVDALARKGMRRFMQMPQRRAKVKLAVVSTPKMDFA